MAELGSRGSKIFYGWFIVAALFTIWMVVYGIQYSFGIFFRSLQDAFGCSRGTISWAMTIQLLSFALILVPAGWVIDRFSIRIVYSAAALLFGLPLVLCSRISDPWQLYLLYGLMGISTGIYGPSIFTVITRWFTEKRGLAMGLASSGAGFGALVVPPLTNSLIASYGWRDTFVILGLASFIILSVCTQYIRNRPEPAGEKSPAAEGKPADGGHAPRSKPLCELTFGQTIKTGNILLIIAAATAAQITARMIVVHLAPHAADKGISPFAAALALSAIGCGSVLGRIGMGFVQDRIGPSISMIICLIVMGICLFALPFITSDIAFFIFAILFGLAFGGDIPQVPALTAQCFGVASMGVIYAFVSASVHVACSLGPLAAGYIFDATGSYTVAFLGAGILLFLGVVGVSKIR